MPFLCVITPVFDGCYQAFCDLTLALQKQTLTDFIHVAISDGESPLIRDFVAQQDGRFQYVETPATDPQDRMQRFLSIVGRRDYGLRNYDATRYIFLDADIRLLSDDYFQTLADVHQQYPTQVLLTKVKRGVGVYFPGSPVRCGQMDIANLCVTKRMARNGYPTDYDIWYPYANDYRFYKSLERHTYHLINFVSAEKEGNKTYTNLREFA